MRSFPVLDLDFVRRQFPTLNDEWALFDNAGGSVPLATVIAAVGDFMTRHPVQLGASYALSEEATERVRAGHQAMAELIRADADEVVLGPSTTANLRILAQALRPQWREGDEVVVTNLDHEANVGCWRRLESTGIVIREWRVDPETAALERAALDTVLNERTRLVAFSHCSNIVGGLNDVAAITRRVHEAGALVCVDGVAFAPHRQVDVKALGVDFYALSLYKTYGPHLALLYGQRRHLVAARSQNHFFIDEASLPAKLEPGNPNHELTASLPAILAYFDALDEHHFPGAGGERAERLARVSALVREHEERLAGRLLDFLDSKPNVRIIGPVTADGRVRVPTISFVVDGRDASEIPPQLDPQRIAVRFGHFYAYRLIRDLGLLDRGGVVRVSMVHYNHAAEVERLIRALDAVL